MDRPGFVAQRPFVRPPTRGGEMPPPDHSVRIRDGEREIEVRGNPAFVRQVLDDLPTLMARLRGEAPGRTTISMPAPPPAALLDSAPAEHAVVAEVTRSGHDEAAASHPNGARQGRRSKSAPTTAALEDRVFAVLRGSGRPLAVAAIRQRLDGTEVSGQQVRRLLERAGSSVVVSSERPATYSLR
ncbi:MAG: hypothetical protein JF886_10290 [Candidatus Dormibacteraeota bacterium]|uniref:Uncharacterized protein n=1 Tax=Candidatus Aeolococcus gillhamiae TaxID=3127015 RepID=A0A2W5YXW8_9BACT|nr:hypothetical protein [Candidatus Dormibacteraeota bacterium]PZR77793.1 MAG: hypothetical protein DLM65_14920 [Candidatus Dormibacter sp. RRmetagenome_bin12]